MLDNQKIFIRPVRQTDQRQITNLARFGAHVHQHLDWCQPVDWIGYRPYLVAEWNFQLMAALACPPDPEDIAWIRLFAVTSEVPIQNIWSVLWDVAREQLNTMNVVAAAIPIHKWFQDILATSHFERTVDVVMLQWERGLPPPALKDSSVYIRRMEFEDLSAVHKVDNEAFAPIWRNSEPLLETALSKSAIATVAETSSGIVGYQMSTANSSNGHLARLAVLPSWQGCGVGYALVQNLLIQFHLWGTLRVTVNTQTDNAASVALYKKAGFQRTEETYPVYQVNLKT
jgi:ribosomal protein S18 acetylase RimI-like enzyme